METNELGALIVKSLRTFSNSNVRSFNESITYAELLLTTEFCVEVLKQLSADKQSTVCLSLPKTTECLSYYLAVLQLNWTVIPIDTISPEERTEHIIRQSDAEFYVGKTIPTALQAEFEQIDGGHIFVRKKRSNRQIPDECRLILFTSGSTGIPKGVMHSSKSILPFVHWTIETFNITEEDTILSIAPFHFDLSVFDVFSSLLTGADLLLTDAAQTNTPILMRALIEKFKPSIVYATPSWYKLQTKFNGLEKNSTPRLVLFAGEIFQLDSLYELHSIWTSSVYYNLYGPTETNVCTFEKIDFEAKRSEPYPIGTDCPYSISVIDPETSELLVSSKTQMLGYLKNENPFVSLSGLTYYPTGDLVHQDRQGKLVYSGRKDRMIKRNGYRIEPAEIERSIIALSNIHSCFVTMIDDKLYAVYEGIREISQIQFKIKLNSTLPLYMLPDSFVYLNEFPLNVNGKVDTEKLIELCLKK